jgi:hypothetical protein
MDFCLLEHLAIPVYSTHVHNEEALHSRITDSCRNVRSYPGKIGPMRRYFSSRVAACIEYHEGHFEHYYKHSITATCFGRMTIFRVEISIHIYLFISA